MTTKKQVAYATVAELIELNKAAIAAEYNRSLRDEAFEGLPRDVRCPITFAMPHEHIGGELAVPHMRCVFTVPSLESWNRVNGEIGSLTHDDFNRLTLDISMDAYNALERVELEDWAS